MTAYRGCLAVLVTALAIAGCTKIPELDATVPDSLEAADYPALIPLEPPLFDRPAPREQAEALQGSLESRRNSLERRASQLNDPIIDPETQARMRSGVGR